MKTASNSTLVDDPRGKWIVPIPKKQEGEEELWSRLKRLEERVRNIELQHIVFK